MTVARATSPIVRYVIDYDIPVYNQAKRRAFYREIARLKKKLHMHGKMSTASVVFTSDRELASEIFKIASKYGTANLYRAILESSNSSHTCDKGKPLSKGRDVSGVNRRT